MSRDKMIPFPPRFTVVSRDDLLTVGEHDHSPPTLLTGYTVASGPTPQERFDRAVERFEALVERMERREILDEYQRLTAIHDRGAR